MSERRDIFMSFQMVFVLNVPFLLEVTMKKQKDLNGGESEPIPIMWSAAVKFLSKDSICVKVFKVSGNVALA